MHHSHQTLCHPMTAVRHRVLNNLKHIPEIGDETFETCATTIIPIDCKELGKPGGVGVGDDRQDHHGFTMHNYTCTMGMFKMVTLIFLYYSAFFSSFLFKTHTECASYKQVSQVSGKGPRPWTKMGFVIKHCKRRYK